MNRKKMKAIEITKKLRQYRPNDYKWIQTEEAMEVDGEEANELPIRKFRKPD